MLTCKRKESAFTLIELLVVVIIVAVLASVAVPLLSANVIRAKASEAEAGLGTIRTGLRAFFAENQTYVGATFPLVGINITAANNDGDLDGRYFSDDTYALTTLAATTYCVRVSSTAGNLAPRAADLAVAPNIVLRSINEQGTIFKTLDCT